MAEALWKAHAHIRNFPSIAYNNDRQLGTLAPCSEGKTSAIGCPKKACFSHKARKNTIRNRKKKAIRVESSFQTLITFDPLKSTAKEPKYAPHLATLPFSALQNSSATGVKETRTNLASEASNGRTIFGACYQWCHVSLGSQLGYKSRSGK